MTRPIFNPDDAWLARYHDLERRVADLEVGERLGLTVEPGAPSTVTTIDRANLGGLAINDPYDRTPFGGGTPADETAVRDLMVPPSGRFLVVLSASIWSVSDPAVAYGDVYITDAITDAVIYDPGPPSPVGEPIIQVLQDSPDYFDLGGIVTRTKVITIDPDVEAVDIIAAWRGEPLSGGAGWSYVLANVNLTAVPL